MSQTVQRDHAVVIGAGMAGLTTATALTAAFDRVTVLDRDGLPERAEHRGGVSQGRHVHDGRPDAHPGPARRTRRARQTALFS